MVSIEFPDDEKDDSALRKAFGAEGDVDPVLASLFGPGYLDTVETSEAEPSELAKQAAERGLNFRDVTPSFVRSLELAPVISCEEHQEILLHHLRAYMGIEMPSVSIEQIRATTKHADSCSNDPCRRLNAISTRDNVLTPKRFEEIYGEIIANWIIQGK